MAVFQRDRYQSIAEFCDDLYGDGSNINYDAVASPNQTVYDPNAYANVSYNQNGYSQGGNSNSPPRPPPIRESFLTRSVPRP